MLNRFFKTAAAVAATFTVGTASAVVITANSSWDGQGSVTTNGVTIAACNTSGAGACTSPGSIGTRDIPGIGIGAGVQGQDNNEIDWYSSNQFENSEMLRFTFGTASVIDSLQLGLLFDGPEYADVQETASFRVSYANGGVQTYHLSTLLSSPGDANWNGMGTWIGAGLDEGNAGLWTGLNPFGGQSILQIDMFASRGICGTASACPDQSDYVFRSLRATAVPEPGTLALLGAGLLGMAWFSRRARAARSAI